MAAECLVNTAVVFGLRCRGAAAGRARPAGGGVGSVWIAAADIHNWWLGLPACGKAHQRLVSSLLGWLCFAGCLSQPLLCWLPLLRWPSWPALRRWP